MQFDWDKVYRNDMTCTPIPPSENYQMNCCVSTCSYSCIGLSSSSCTISRSEMTVKLTWFVFVLEFKCFGIRDSAWFYHLLLLHEYITSVVWSIGINFQWGISQGMEFAVDKVTIHFQENKSMANLGLVLLLLTFWVKKWRTIYWKSFLHITLQELLFTRSTKV